MWSKRKDKKLSHKCLLHIGNKKASQGFTLIELMMLISITGILLTVAVPNFSVTIKDSKLDSNASRFMSDLSLTRSEAIKRGERVTICKSNDQSSCSTVSTWNQGWIVFVDNVTENGQVDAGEIILRVKEALDGGNQVVASNNVNNYISYVSDGFSRMTSGAVQVGDIALCDDRKDDSKSPYLRINPTGRPLLGKVSESPLTCGA